LNDSERQLFDGFTFLLGIFVGGLAAAGLSLAAKFMETSAGGAHAEHAEAAQAMTEAESPLAPIGRIALLGDAELASAAAAITAAPRPVDTVLSGPQVFNEACYQCHADGAVIPGAPIVGDTAAWEARVAQGLEILYDHAINGFQGEAMVPMPPKGGRVDLSDDEIRSAVDYMVEQLP
jgi:cytochrome c5